MKMSDRTAAIRRDESLGPMCRQSSKQNDNQTRGGTRTKHVPSPGHKTYSPYTPLNYLDNKSLILTSYNCDAHSSDVIL